MSDRKALTPCQPPRGHRRRPPGRRLGRGAAAAVLALTAVIAAPSQRGGTPPFADAAAQTPTKPPNPTDDAPAPLAPISIWQDALNSFRYQDFDRAIPRLRDLLYPKPRLEREREWKAREYLGASLWWAGKQQEALDEFTALLVRNPEARLDPAAYPPQMIRDFEALRGNLQRLGVLRPGQKAAPAPRQLSSLPPLALSFFPFGVGQFANHEPGKGAAFLTSQALLAGTSAGLYLYNRDEGLASRRPSLTRGAQVAAGSLFWAVAAWGIVDAVLVRRSLVEELRGVPGLRAPEAGAR